MVIFPEHKKWSFQVKSNGINHVHSLGSWEFWENVQRTNISSGSEAEVCSKGHFATHRKIYQDSSSNFVSTEMAAKKYIHMKNVKEIERIHNICTTLCLTQHNYIKEKVQCDQSPVQYIIISKVHHIDRFAVHGCIEFCAERSG